MGHQAMTCDNYPGVCPNQAVIDITPGGECPAAAENEAGNSRSLYIILRQHPDDLPAPQPFDMHGYCGESPLSNLNRVNG